MGKYSFGAHMPTFNGIPMINMGRFTNPWATHYFVDGDNGSDSHDGKSTTKSFATIQKAVTASKGGDVIYINPKGFLGGSGFGRYTEDVIVYGGVGANAAAGGSGISIPGANRSIIGVTPRGTPTDFLGVRLKHATAVAMNVEAPGTHIENIGFFVEGATYGVYFESDGATYGKQGGVGSSMYNCAVKGEGGVFADGTDELQIINCRFQAKYDGTTSGVIITEAGTNYCRRPIVRGCTFLGGNAADMDSAPIIWTGRVQQGVIDNNIFLAATSSVYINMATSATGIISNNVFADADISSTGIVQDSMVCVNNKDLGGEEVAA